MKDIPSKKARKRRGFARLAAIGMMTLIPIIGNLAPASAHDGDHWWPTDGCTAPAPYPYFDHACVHHDGCYRNHWADRATCDQWFLNDMIEKCRTLPFEIVTSCAGTAYMYYGAVRLFGDAFYNHSDTVARTRTPVA